MSYKIIKGMPIPKKIRANNEGSGRRREEEKFPFRKLEVGDCFVIESASKNEQQKVMGCLSRYKKQGRFLDSYKIKTRYIELGKLGVWRVQ